MNTDAHFARLLLIVTLACVTGCSILGKAEKDYIGNSGDSGPADADVVDSHVDAPDTVACGDCEDPDQLCRVTGGGMPECVDCLGDGDCSTGSCNVEAGTCEPCTAGSCRADLGLTCDESDGACVECFGDITCETGDFCVDRECVTCEGGCGEGSICELNEDSVPECVECDGDGDGFPREECGPIERTATSDSVPVDCDDGDGMANPGLLCASCRRPESIFGGTVEHHGIAQRVGVATTTELKVVIIEDAVHVLYVEDASGDGTPDMVQDVVATLRNGRFAVADPEPVTAVISGTTHPVGAVTGMDAQNLGSTLFVGFIDDERLIVSGAVPRITRDIAGPGLSLFRTISDGVDSVMAIGNLGNEFRWYVASDGLDLGSFEALGVRQFDADGSAVAFRKADRIEVGRRGSSAETRRFDVVSNHAAMVATRGNRRILLYENGGVLSSHQYQCVFDTRVDGCELFSTRDLVAGELIEGAYHEGIFPIVTQAAESVSLRFLDEIGEPATRADATWPVAELFAGRFTTINDIAIDSAPLGEESTLVVAVASGRGVTGDDEIWMMSYLFCSGS